MLALVIASVGAGKSILIAQTCLRAVAKGGHVVYVGFKFAEEGLRALAPESQG